MRIAVIGATGFIGRGLVNLFLERGHDVIAFSRNLVHARRLLGEKVMLSFWSGKGTEQTAKTLDGIDVIVNLAGENIGDSLWTQEKRRQILASRINAGRFATGLIRSMKAPPKLLVQASAVGYYGSREDETLNESSSAGSGFLPDICIKWEQSSSDVESMGIRRVIIRTGIVLSANGGAFPKIALPYRLHIGVMLGSGNQWLPWIHYRDEIKAICYLIENDRTVGVYNLVAPNVVRMSELCRNLGRTLLNIPPAIVQLALGQMGRETVLVSQRVVPDRLLKDGFKHEFPEITQAISDLG